MWFDERRRPRGLGASPAALLLALLAGLAAYAAAQQPTPTPLVDGASEDRQKINNLLIEYARDVRAVLHGGGDAELALRHFDRSLGVWFEENFRRLAEFNTAMPGQPADDAARRRVAVDALCRYGPPMLSYRLDRIEFAGPRALLVLTETAATGNLTYYIPLRRDPTNRWVFTTFFWSELMVWQPILILDKRIRDVALTPEEEAFARTRQQARERFLQFCAETGVEPPLRF